MCQASRSDLQNDAILFLERLYDRLVYGPQRDRSKEIVSRRRSQAEQSTCRLDLYSMANKLAKFIHLACMLT